MNVEYSYTLKLISVLGWVCCYQDLIRPTQTGVIDKEWAWKGTKFPLETLCGHLPEVHFHTPIQKVRGYVGGFT